MTKSKHFHKHKILLDENVHYRAYFPELNNLFDLKHITEDYHKTGLSDLQVFNHAVKTGRIIVTFNFKDFQDLVGTNYKTGVVGISSNLPIEIIDKKLSAFFRKATSKSLLGRLKILSGQTTI